MSHPIGIKTGREGKVYRVLRQAALDGLPCPTNAEIAVAAGYATRSSAGSAVWRLAKEGLFQIERLGSARDIVFPDQVRTNSRAGFDAVRHNAALIFGLEPYQLVGRSRKLNIVRARVAAAWVLRTKHKLSYPAIGQILGGRDHSSAIHYQERAEYYRERDPEFRAATEALLHGEPVERIHCKAISRAKTIAEVASADPVWCSQCESRVSPRAALRCTSRWCSLKVVA